MFLRRLLAYILSVPLLMPVSTEAATKKKPDPKTAQKPAPKPAQKTAPKKAPKDTPKAKPLAKAPEEEEDELSLAAKGAIVIEAFSGKPLYQKNADSRFYPASTTKIMTGLLVIETGNLDALVEITAEDAKVGESSLNVHPGEQFTRRQMLFGLMLKSANDVAAALGRDNGGSIEAFAAKMTQRARELGCTNTQFANPHGLHNINHYTTPRDLAIIARAAMQQPLFRQIVATKQARWETPAGLQLLTNHNRLLDRFAGCNGVKTGYTIPAQQVLASSAARDGREAIAVVMYTNKPGIWEDSAKLLEFGLRPSADPE
jgi:D-alanyl-D-alanine carboxypeptidase (penicillin-binding protein 5/6)